MKRKGITLVCFIAGLICCAYPLIGNIIERNSQQKAIATYERAVEQTADIESALEEAVQYNEMLAQTKGAIVGDLQEGILSKENYERLLNISGTGIMGTIEIPKINVNLPIYHGTSEEILAIGAGHIEGTALPTGGKNNRCVITGHRGLPNSKLFTRLDELEKQDLFFIHVFDEILAYEVVRIEVTDPDEMEILMPEEGEDYVSLVTCTPYGINTHRLVVTGKRTDYQEKERLNIQKTFPSLREMIFTVLPFIFLITAILFKWKERKKRRW